MSLLRSLHINDWKFEGRKQPKFNDFFLKKVPFQKSKWALFLVSVKKANCIVKVRLLPRHLTFLMSPSRQRGSISTGRQRKKERKKKKRKKNLLKNSLLFQLLRRSCASSLNICSLKFPFLCPPGFPVCGYLLHFAPSSRTCSSQSDVSGLAAAAAPGSPRHSQPL